MIKNRSDLMLGTIWLLMAGLNYPDHHRPAWLPVHRHEWLIWLIWLIWPIGAATWIYGAFRAPPRPRVRKDPLTTLPEGKWYAISTALFVLFVLTAPLWHEFRVPGQPLWNGFLAAFLVSLVIGSFAGIRYLQRNRIQVGEARFNSSENKNP
jgi:hypothetical protein